MHIRSDVHAHRSRKLLDPVSNDDGTVSRDVPGIRASVLTRARPQCGRIGTVNIVVGVTGGIAAYKTVHLVRLLIKAGHEVTVVPTPDALRFVGAPTWEAISRNPVTTSVHEDVARVRHVALGQAADLVIVAPATANTIAKMAAGLADDLLGTTLLATTAPLVVAPAMHTEMWHHPSTRANIATLRERGVHIVGPDAGELTGGDSGPGRMTEPEQILERAFALAGSHQAAGKGGAAPVPTSRAASSVGSDDAPAVADRGARRDLAGLRVAISAGGTREPIDPVRYLGNRSSGRQGVALAAAAAERGAEVVLVAANIAADVLADAWHSSVAVVSVATAAELSAAMRDAAAASDVIVMAAAVADYRPASVSDAKLTKETGRLTSIELVENEDVLAGLAATRREGQIIVGFAAESPDADLLARTARKRERKGADLLVVNVVGWDQGFEASDNAVQIIGAGGDVVATASGPKRHVAGAVWDAVLAHRG